MKQKKKDNRYSYPLKLDNKFKNPLSKLAEANRRKLNDEINLAVEFYLEHNREKIK